jgi:hypothetical protein
VRSVEDNAHGQTTNSTGDRDGHDPGEDEETNSLPVDSLDGSVAETDTNGSTSDAHGSRDRERVLREDQDGESGTHLHRATCDELASVGQVEEQVEHTSARRVVGDLVTHDLHDVVTVGDQTKRQGGG